MKKLVIALIALCTMACNVPLPEDVNVVIDQSSDNVHRIFEQPHTYQAFHDLLVDEGYNVNVWMEGETFQTTWATLVGCPASLCGEDIEPADIDVLVVSTPRDNLGNPFYLGWAEQWVAAGGALILIADHWPHTAPIRPMAAQFGAAFEHTGVIIGDSVTHCADGESWCDSDKISYKREDAPMSSLFVGTPFVTTYGGTSIEDLGANGGIIPLLQLGSPFRTYGTQNDRSGEVTMAMIRHGSGLVILAAEAAMWSCGQGGIVSFPIGWCPENAGLHGKHNDKFIKNLFMTLRLEMVN
jgi:hypothetical protein